MQHFIQARWKFTSAYAFFEWYSSDNLQGWPKFAQSIVQQTTADNGLAVVVYAPANVSVPAVGGSAHLVITTDYPFSDTVELHISSQRPFPLRLRIPAWVDGATVSIGEDEALQHAVPGSFHVVKQVGGGDGPTSFSTVPALGAASVGTQTIPVWHIRHTGQCGVASRSAITCTSQVAAARPLETTNMSMIVALPPAS